MAPPVPWCGEFGDAPLMAHTLSPCYLEPASAVLLVLLAAPVLTLALLRARAAAAAAAAAGARPRGITGLDAGWIGGALMLVALHAAHLGAALAWAPLRGMPFHAAFHAACLAVWSAAAAVTWRAAGTRTAVDLRALVVAAAVVYSGLVYAYFAVYLGGLWAMPRTYLKSQVWSYMLCVMFDALLVSLEWRKPRADRAGYAPLADAEAPPGADGAPAERTWVSLFVSACTFVWPEAPALRMRVFACVALLALMRVLNLAVPVFYKQLVDRMAAASEAPSHERPSFVELFEPWEVLYLGAIFFQGGAGGGITGAVNNLRSWLWIPVSQDAFKRISEDVFAHVLQLDLAFHLARKTGEVTKVVDRGTSSMQNVLSTVLFSIAPQLFDMLAAATYLAGALEPWIALIVFVTIGSYIPLTIALTEWRASFRRTMNNADNAKGAKVTDALLNWETVKYFTAEEEEQGQFANTINGYQTAEYVFVASLNLLNVVQSGIMFVGIAAGMAVCTLGVTQGSLSVGDVVLFLTMMAQLYGPLNFFGTYYRVIQQQMIDMENLFQLLDRRAGVCDAPDAKALVLSGGTVAFENVDFSYVPGSMVLKGVSFNAPGGTTMAFVGATGSGKSTLTRLLFRFYDVTGGAVCIDGQDVRRLTQQSLRGAIGMVPQDCVLFNDTIRYNIRYGRVGATDEEVEDAARAACIHDAITTRFPKGYDTVVGERGLRLSGGEKQRVAFARALLKNPPILVLDEATSALDTITEKSIQAALRGMRQSRTMLMVAHRLSTIVDADCIVVMSDGCIAERGPHGELLAQGGRYAEMWAKQAATRDDGGDGGGAAGTPGASPAPSASASAANLAALAEGATEAANGGAAPAAKGAGRRRK